MLHRLLKQIAASSVYGSKHQLVEACRNERVSVLVEKNSSGNDEEIRKSTAQI